MRVTSRSTPPTTRDLSADERGAVMLVGLCMACFLIGALWFAIGIGDAIIFRDGMQEVSDHAAFTAAVLHAKGMNFISACNLMILGMVAVHVMMGVLNDALQIAAILLAIPSGGDSINVAKAFNEAYKAYGKTFKPAAKALHGSEVTASFGYPVLAFGKGRSLGADYAGFSPRERVLDVMTVSPSMIPGGAQDVTIASVFSQSGVKGPSIPQDKRKGLPVTAHPFKDVCKKVATSGASALGELAGGADPSGKAAQNIGQASASVIQSQYCNDKVNSGGADPGKDTWWGEDGPLYPWGGTRNGSAWQDVWAINVKPKFQDAQEHAVAIAPGKLGLVSSTKEPPAYMSQAEFYFDCNKTWSDPTCNGDDNAAYSIRWRARLKRLNLDLVANTVKGFGSRFFEASAEAQSAGISPAIGDSGKLTKAVDDSLQLFKNAK